MLGPSSFEVHSGATLDLSHLIASGSRVFLHGGAATHPLWVQSLAALKGRVQDVTIHHLHTHGDAVYAKPEFRGTFWVHNLFLGKNMRKHFDADQVDYIPCFLSEIGLLFRRKVIPLDVALLHVGEPDHHGFVSLGVSVDVAKAAWDSARIRGVIINPMMPRTHGDGFVRIQDADYIFRSEVPLFENQPDSFDQAVSQIGNHIASLIEDGSTLQMGIGAIPEAVLSFLGHHKDLGVHTEMFTESLLPLLEKGVVTNRFKKIHPGKTVATFLVGNKRLYDFVHDNPEILLLEADYVNQPNVIARNPKVVAINSCVEMDLTGQVCADSVGTRIVSGVGGQMDFIRGAFLSPGGKPIMAFKSVTATGQSRIVAELKPGAGVVTTRAHVHYVVTEWGVANLAGLSLAQRAKALISLAHPDHREALERAWRERLRKENI